MSNHMSDLDAIRERHRSVAFPVTAWCIEDVQEWPCDAVRLLDEVEALNSKVVLLGDHLQLSGIETKALVESASRIIEAADQLADAAGLLTPGLYLANMEAQNLRVALERYRKERG